MVNFGFAPMANFGGGGLGGANFGGLGGIAFVPMAISGDFGGNFGLSSSGFGNFGTESDDGLNAGLAFGERGRGLAFATGGGLFGSGDVG